MRTAFGHILGNIFVICFIFGVIVYAALRVFEHGVQIGWDARAKHEHEKLRK